MMPVFQFSSYNESQQLAKLQKNSNVIKTQTGSKWFTKNIQILF